MVHWHRPPHAPACRDERHPASPRSLSLQAKIEAVIYAAEEPVTLLQLAGLLGNEARAELDLEAARQAALPLLSEEASDAQTPPLEEAAPATPDDAAEKRLAREREREVRDYLRGTVDTLMRTLAEGDRGVEIREVAGGYRMSTKPEYHDAVRGFVRALKPPLKLTLQALETLAVVAYKQPVTAPEVGEIRGVDSGGVLGSLMTRKLVTTAGRKQVIGRPILYRTTNDFLIRFGLKDISELPGIEEFERMAGALAEQEEIVMAEPAPHDPPGEDLLPEQGVTEPQADGDTTPLEAPAEDSPSQEAPGEPRKED